MSSLLKLLQVMSQKRLTFSYRPCSAQQLQVLILHHMCSRSSAVAQLKTREHQTAARTRTKKRPCVSRWKLRLHRSRLRLLKLRSVRELIRMPAAKRRRRLTRDAKKKRCRECRRKNKKGRGRKMPRQTRCVRCNKTRREWMSSSAISSL